MKSILGLLTLLLIGSLTLADEKPPKADVRGKVDRITLKDKKIVGFFVDGKSEKDTQYDKASVTLRPKAKIYKWVKGKKEEAKLEDIKKGAIVQCVFEGAVRESFPVQADAIEVLILEES
jgi:hypothetical protein